MTVGNDELWFGFVVFLPNSSQIISCHREDGAWLWDEDGKEHHIILSDQEEARRIAFSSCSQWRVGMDQSKVFLWKSPTDVDPEDWRTVSVFEACVGDLEGLVWRPNTLEFATVSRDGSVRVWRVVVMEGSGKVSVQLVWSYGGKALAASDADLVDTVGLSAINHRLLEQHGAVDEVASLEDQ